MPDVIYLSEQTVVHTAYEWHKIESIEHFWIKRRFNVLRKMGGGLDFSSGKIAEVGCGYGLLQKQFENYYGVMVDGFDLNAKSLRDSVATNQPRFYYNILDRNPKLSGYYDFIILFNLIERQEDERSFLEAATFHLKPGGYLLINVLAMMSLYSIYDEMSGHRRRYTLQQMDKLCNNAGLETIIGTYWGLPLVPLLMFWNKRVSWETYPQTIIESGYSQPGPFSNQILNMLSTLEIIPQRWYGTSLMAIYRKWTIW